MWHNWNTFPQAAQKVRPAKPQPMKAPEAELFSPAHPKLPRQLVLRVGYVEDVFEGRRSMGKGASLGKEAVSADSGWVGEVAARVGRVRKAAFSAA